MEFSASLKLYLSCIHMIQFLSKINFIRCLSLPLALSIGSTRYRKAVKACSFWIPLFDLFLTTEIASFINSASVGSFFIWSITCTQLRRSLKIATPEPELSKIWSQFTASSTTRLAWNNARCDDLSTVRRNNMDRIPLHLQKTIVEHRPSSSHWCQSLTHDFTGTNLYGQLLFPQSCQT